VLYQLGDFNGSEQHFRTGVEILAALISRSPENQRLYLEITTPRLELAALLIHEGKRSEAETLIREVGATDTALAQNELARYLATWAAPQERDGRRAVIHAEKAVAATNRRNESYLDTLAAAYALAGDFTNAVSVQREAGALTQNSERTKDVEFRVKLYQSNETYVDDVILAKTAGGLLAAGRFTAAEPLARDCVRILEGEQPDGPGLFKARSLLGRALLGQGKYAEAEPLLLSCYESLKSQTNSVPATCQATLKEVLQCIVQVYGATGRTEARDKWQRKLTGLTP
jgi:tetratricopeptide (TPR) repeat protein